MRAEKKTTVSSFNIIARLRNSPRARDNESLTSKMKYLESASLAPHHKSLCALLGIENRNQLKLLFFCARLRRSLSERPPREDEENLIRINK